MEEDQPIKLIMTWDITPEHEQEYFEFVIRDYIPGIQRVGCDLSDAWATVYGTQPQIMVGVLLQNAKIARQVLISEEWEGLNSRLQEFIHNFTTKMVYAKSSFQI